MLWSDKLQYSSISDYFRQELLRSGVFIRSKMFEVGREEEKNGSIGRWSGDGGETMLTIFSVS